MAVTVVQEVSGAFDIAVESTALVPPGDPEFIGHITTDDLDDHHAIRDLDHAAAIDSLPLSFAQFAEEGVPGPAPATAWVVDMFKARQGMDDHAALKLDPPAFVGLVPVVWVHNPGGAGAAVEELDRAVLLGAIQQRKEKDYCII